MTKLTTTKADNFVKIDKDGQLVLNMGNGILVLPNPNGYKGYQAYDEAINVRAGPAIEKMHDLAEQVKHSIDSCDGDQEWKEMCQQQHLVLVDLMGAMVDFVPLASHWMYDRFNKSSNADAYRVNSDERSLAGLWRKIQSAIHRSFQLTIKGMRQLSMRNPTPESTAAICAMEEWARNPLGFSTARTMQVVGQAIAAVVIIRDEAAKRGDTEGVKKADYLKQMLMLMAVVGGLGTAFAVSQFGIGAIVSAVFGSIAVVGGGTTAGVAVAGVAAVESAAVGGAAAVVVAQAAPVAIVVAQAVAPPIAAAGGGAAGNVAAAAAGSLLVSAGIAIADIATSVTVVETAVVPAATLAWMVAPVGAVLCCAAVGGLYAYRVMAK